jgi:hypothetical protein
VSDCFGTPREQFISYSVARTTSPTVFGGVPVALSLVFCVMFCRSLFVLFHLAIEIETNINQKQWPIIVK